jgi:NADH-ubiquinone oxidoreductase chain 2
VCGVTRTHGSLRGSLREDGSISSGKQSVLFSAIGSGYFFMAFVAIVVSVISASYYLRIIRELHSESDYEKKTSETGSIIMSESDGDPFLYLSNKVSHSKLFTASGAYGLESNRSLFLPSFQIYPGAAVNKTYLNLTNTHAFIIATLTLSIIFYVLKPSILLNSAVLSTLSLFYF